MTEIRDANLDGLARAAEHWRRMAGLLRQADEEFDASVVRVVGENWQGGFTSGLAYHDLRVSNRQLSDAAIEADALANELGNAHSRFTGARKSFQTVLDEIAADGMTWSDVLGRTLVSWPEGQTLGPAMSDHALEYQQRKAATAQRLADQLESAVSAARTADADAARALMRAVGGSDEKFNANPTADPYADTQRATDLLKKAPQLSKAELAELQQLLDANDGNDLFAETIMRNIGPAKLLDVTSAFNDERMTKLLGETLASASPALGKDPTWLAALTEAALEYKGYGYPGYPQGYLTLDQLLRHGEYDGKFLVTVGKDLIAFDKAGDKGRVWPPGSPDRDPVVGLLTALKNNPDAATTFFASPDAKDQIAYLAHDRQVDPMMFGPNKYQTKTHLDTLGEALVAASTGRPTTQGTLTVVTNMVHALGVNPPEDLPPELQPAVTKVLAENIQSVHVGLTTAGPVDGLFRGEQPVAQFERGTLVRTLSALGEHKDGLAPIVQAEAVYAVTGMELIKSGQAAHDMTFRDHVSDYAQAYGVMDAIVGDKIREDLKDATEHNDKVGLWTSNIAGAGATILPFVGDVAERGVNLYITDKTMEANKSLEDSASMQYADAYDTGLGTVQQTVNQWIDNHGGTAEEQATLRQNTTDMHVNYNTSRETVTGSLGR